MEQGGGLKNNLRLGHNDPLLAARENPRKQLKLERIKLADMPFVGAFSLFAMRHLQRRQLGCPPDEKGVVYAKHPHSSVEREVVHCPEPPALLHELNLVEVRVSFANDAGRAVIWTNKDCLRHEGGEGNVGFVG